MCRCAEVCGFEGEGAADVWLAVVLSLRRVLHDRGQPIAGQQLGRGVMCVDAGEVECRWVV